MDKELLRIVIIATGLIIIVGMLLWAYFRNQRNHNATGFFSDVEGAIKSTFASKPAKPKASVDFDRKTGRFEVKQERNHDAQGYAKNQTELRSEPSLDTAAEPRLNADWEADSRTTASEPSMPRLIQFSIVAKTEEGFNGATLDSIFNMIGLEYGSMKIYERLDINRMVDFGVASMINPGTFPDEDKENFYTPGITFFMQPQELPDATLVFDDLVRTINLLEEELDGIKWDASRKPLKDATIKDIRKSLKIT